VWKGLNRIFVNPYNIFAANIFWNGLGSVLCSSAHPTVLNPTNTKFIKDYKIEKKKKKLKKENASILNFYLNLF
jgi:hypothetical protein